MLLGGDLTLTKHSIEPVQLAPNLMYFYWGRHPDHENSDMRLGGGAHVIFEGNEAIAFDSMNIPGQGDWVRQYMQDKFGIEHFRLVTSHWHWDHIGCNSTYSDCTIIGHTRTRELMLEHKSKIEKGWPVGKPAFPVIPPNVTFNGRLDLWCGNTEVQLHEFNIHVDGHLAIYLPQQKIFLAADMLEDPIWIFDFDFAPPEVQIAEYRRMMSMDIECIYPTHGDLDTIRNGGYKKTFIDNNIDYLNRMIEASSASDFMEQDVQQFISKELERGDLHWWEPYSEVHEINRRSIARLKT